MSDLSALEKQRIAEIIASAVAEDWERFTFLTDRPFSNAATMREQFEDCSRLIKTLGVVLGPHAHVKSHEDGSRMIFAEIALGNPTENPIQLTLHSTSERADAVISIWTFFQEVSFD